MKKTVIAAVILALSALYSITPLLLSPEFSFGGDSHNHLNWAGQVSAGIKEGIVYPRWLADSNSGYGSPTTIFYSPLFFWITGVANLFMPSLAVSLKIVTFAGFLFSGISMYLLLRNFCGNSASVAGGIAYQLLPYHAFDLYVRWVLPETFAFLWLPLILHFTYKGFKEGSLPAWIGLALSYAGLILTHVVSAYIFTFVMTLYALFLFMERKNVRVLLKFISASLFGVCLAAVYFIPMVFERKFIHIDWITDISWGDYRHNFLFLSEGGYVQFNINLKLIAGLLVLLAVASFRIWDIVRRRQGHHPNNSCSSFFFWLFLFSLFISTPFSIPLWEITPGLPTIQFPWRWLMVSTFATAVLVGLTFENMWSLTTIKKDRLFSIYVGIFYALVFSNVYLTSRYLSTVEPLKKEEMEWVLKNGGDVIEYRPIWLTQKGKDFSKEKRIPVSFKEGAGKVNIISWKTQYRQLTVNAAISSTLRISTFYYPGWTAFLNGSENPIGIEKESGAMLLNIPQGENIISLEFRDTPLRNTAKRVSTLSLVIAFISLIFARRKKQSSGQ